MSENKNNTPSFYDLISEKITSNNNDISIIDSNLIHYSYANLYHRIKEIETQFKRLKLTKNSLLILQTDKSFNSLAYLICCIKMGIIYIPIDENSHKKRIDKIIESSQANAILNPDFSIQKLSEKKQSFSTEITCILYTSGSTGTPKGVVISSAGLIEFINWSLNEFSITSKDTLTAFAPFHFDLSTFDIFAGLSSGASIWLINQKTSSNFRLIGEMLKKVNPTIWYATPTFFILLNQYGKLPTNYCPRLVLFAGEVFPISKLNELRKQWKQSAYYNLYGPTETNVCTFYKLPTEIENNRTTVS